MKPIHPGRILRREMEARELSINKLALALRVPSGRISQTRYDLVIVENEKGERIKAEVMQVA